MVSPKEFAANMARIAPADFDSKNVESRRRALLAAHRGYIPEGRPGPGGTSEMKPLHAAYFIISAMATDNLQEAAVSVDVYGQLKLARASFSRKARGKITGGELPVEKWPFPDLTIAEILAIFIDLAKDDDSRATLNGIGPEFTFYRRVPLVQLHRRSNRSDAADVIKMDYEPVARDDGLALITPTHHHRPLVSVTHTFDTELIFAAADALAGRIPETITEPTDEGLPAVSISDLEIDAPLPMAAAPPDGR